MAQLLPKSIDVLTPEQRHRCMSHIRSSNTRPERIVRRFLFACGMRFRKNVKTLPGTPDIVLRKYRTVIFVNGCFGMGTKTANTIICQSRTQHFGETKSAATASAMRAMWRNCSIWVGM